MLRVKFANLLIAQIFKHIFCMIYGILKYSVAELHLMNGDISLSE